MDLFSLPARTRVNRVVPKNAFDEYTNAKQRKLFTEWVERITWLNKIAPETVNLEAKEIEEIQIFLVEIKVQQVIQPVLDTIDRAIPYPIIFIVQFENQVYVSTTAKHAHLVQASNAVIDYNFRSDWFDRVEQRYALNLSRSIDAVYADFCSQFASDGVSAFGDLTSIVEQQKKIDFYTRQIGQLRAKIAAAKQFNVKVELNAKLQVLEDELRLFRNTEK